MGTYHAGWSQSHPTTRELDKLHIYLDVEDTRSLKAFGSSAGWTSDPAGRIVLMQPWYNDALWADLHTRQDLPVVSTLQLILDPWHYLVRGREQARHLLDLHISEQYHLTIPHRSSRK